MLLCTIEHLHPTFLAIYVKVSSLIDLILAMTVSFARMAHTAQEPDSLFGHHAVMTDELAVH